MTNPPDATPNPDPIGDPGYPPQAAPYPQPVSPPHLQTPPSHVEHPTQATPYAPGQHAHAQGAVPLPRNSVTLPEPLATLPQTAWRWIGTLVGAFAGLTIALGVLILGAITLASDDSGSLNRGDLGLPSGFDDESLPRKVLWLATYGWTSHASEREVGSDSVDVAALTLPLSVWALLALVALVLLSRVMTQRTPPSGRAQLWMQISLTVFFCGTLLLFLGLVSRYTIDGDRYSALSFYGLVRCLVAVGAALAIGAALSVPSGHRLGALFGPKLGGALTRMWPSIDIAKGHVLGWAAVGVVVTGVGLFTGGADGMQTLAVSTAPLLAVMGAALGHLGGYSFGGTPISLFDEHPWYYWLLVPAAILVIGLLAARLTLRRAPGATVSPGNLGISAGAMLVTWLVVAELFGVVRISSRYGSSGDVTRDSASMGPAWWTFLILAITAVIVELVHGFLGTQLVQAAPSGLLKRLVPNPHPAWSPYLADLAAARSAASRTSSAAVPPNWPQPQPPVGPPTVLQTPVPPLGQVADPMYPPTQALGHPGSGQPPAGPPSNAPAPNPSGDPPPSPPGHGTVND